MGGDVPKQYLKIRDKEMICHVIDRLGSHPRIHGLVIGADIHDDQFQQCEGNVVAISEAGPERAITVYNGLQKIIDLINNEKRDVSDIVDNDWVMVHDAARPLLRSADIDRLIDAAARHRDGAILAMPLVDTIKRSDSSTSIVETLDRSILWRAATPQLFPLQRLYHALDETIRKGITVTDEANAMELVGARPVLVEGASDNIKVTTPADLKLAEWLLTQQVEEELQ
ncbi:MAG: 2-C-methyl-D-erythritol 4-phosphate cytidylyltransferase [marine bacterium B5-7]|nr:MAG: 2-C-methyl-D-erythritol 4-phosphate cytidylyltransferase [marine bacterium B5-7]